MTGVDAVNAHTGARPNTDLLRRLALLVQDR